MKQSVKLMIFIATIIFYAVGIPVAYCEANKDIVHFERVNKKQNGVIIQYKENAPRIKSISKTISSKITSREKLSEFIELIHTEQDVDNFSLIKELKNDGSILYVEEDKKLKLYSQPNDPGYSKQWGLRNIMAEDAWALLPSLNKPVVVAVIDSGLEATHFDLVNRIAPGGYNFFSNNSNFNDTNGHGTAVSGVIAAQTNNSIGIAGVAGVLEVKILPLKTADNSGISQLSDVIRAIDYAIEKNVDVINLSMGSNKYSDIENAAVQRAVNKGIVVVAAAGNEGASYYDYPASYDGVLSVGSIASDNVVSGFSNRNDKVDVVAPGENIYSCYKNNSYASLDGTSFSAPVVSGVAAILKAIDPSLNPHQIAAIIQTSAIDLGPTGRDNLYGYGAVNLYHAASRFAHVAVTGITLNKTSMNLAVGDTGTLIAAVFPTNASNKNIAWATDNPAAAVVCENGVVTAIGAGKATIIAITEDRGKTATCAVTVKEPFVPVAGIVLEQECSFLIVGNTFVLNATVFPANASNKNISWATDNPAVAIVSENGVVTAVGAGKATIIAITEDGGKTVTCHVTVNPSIIPVSGVSLDPKTLVLTEGGETYVLTAAVEPANATNKKVLWYTSNQKVATVSASGLIISVGAGNAIIRVTTEEGGFVDSCIVSVREKVLPTFDGIELPAKTDISPDKTWTIRFNMIVDVNSLNNQNIYVTDVIGNKVKIEIIPGVDGSSALVVPISSYQSGQTYYLYISKGIRSQAGKNLKQGVFNKFTIM